MIRPGRERLKGDVEVDETYISISDRRNIPSKEGRQSNTAMTLVAVAVELIQPKGFGRIRFRRISAGTERILLRFIRDEVERGSVIHTDGSKVSAPF